MKFFSLIEKKDVHISKKKKVIPAEEFSKLIEAEEILLSTRKDAESYREDVVRECEKLKEQAQKEGFQEGLEEWNRQLRQLEEEIKRVRRETEKAIVPLALTAVKKMIGRELETDLHTIVDIITTALKNVSQHKRITIYVSKTEVDYVESHRSEIKSLFEHLESLKIAPREDVKEGGCIIETEAGIINAQLENQLTALETAFRNFLKNHQGG